MFRWFYYIIPCACLQSIVDALDENLQCKHTVNERKTCHHCRRVCPHGWLAVCFGIGLEDHVGKTMRAKKEEKKLFLSHSKWATVACGSQSVPIVNETEECGDAAPILMKLTRNELGISLLALT